MIKFTVYIEIVLLSAELLLIHGDFKIHTAVHDDSNCVPFKDLLDSTGLQKNDVKSPTQLHGHLKIQLFCCGHS